MGRTGKRFRNVYLTCEALVIVVSCNGIGEHRDAREKISIAGSRTPAKGVCRLSYLSLPAESPKTIPNSEKMK
jgi:hypothetical protein